MSQATVRNGPHTWTEISDAQNPFSSNTDFTSAILHSGSKENFAGNICSSSEPEIDYVSDDFLIDGAFMEFTQEDDAGIAANLGNQDSSIHFARSSKTNLRETLSNSSSFPWNHKEVTVNKFEQSLDDRNDLFTLPTSNITEPEWVSTLNEVPLIFGTSTFHEDSFLISNHGSFTYGYGVGQFVCEEGNPNPPSCEGVAFKHEASSGSRVPVPGRARSKRSRSGVRPWSTGMLLSCSSPTNSSDSTTTCPSSTTTITKHHRQYLCQSEIESAEECEGLGASPSCTRAMAGSPSPATPSCKPRKPQEGLQPRRCAHCQTPKTPQWRAGPTGPKALCNACGVRYKSGRLFPEYRPARSPTFSAQRHSNSHKKVMEMRVHMKMVGLLQVQAADQDNPSQAAGEI